MPKDIGIEEIYAILEQELVNLSIRPGDVLSENILCKRFGVSRTPIRSVLQRLEQNRFVKIVPHHGTIVTPIDLEIASQVLYQRLAVESMVLRDFIRSCTPLQVEEVRYALEQLRAVSVVGEDPYAFDHVTFLKYDLAMHAIWFKYTDKMFLWEWLMKPQADYARLMQLDIVGGQNTRDVLEEHTEIMRLIDEKRPEQVEALMSRHLYGNVRRLGSKIFSEEYRVYFKGTSE